jgi:hypothetical protein
MARSERIDATLLKGPVWKRDQTPLLGKNRRTRNLSNGAQRCEHLRLHRSSFSGITLFATKGRTLFLNTPWTEHDFGEVCLRRNSPLVKIPYESRQSNACISKNEARGRIAARSPCVRMPALRAAFGQKTAATGLLGSPTGRATKASPRALGVALWPTFFHYGRRSRSALRGRDRSRLEALPSRRCPPVAPVVVSGRDAVPRGLMDHVAVIAETGPHPGECRARHTRSGMTAFCAKRTRNSPQDPTGLVLRTER